MNAQESRIARIDPQKINEILERQAGLAEEFLQILAEEKTALADRDVQALITLSRKKENQLTRIQRLDSSFQEEARRLLPEPPRRAKVVKLADLIPLVSAEEADRLAACRERLTALREEILVRNLFNKQWAEDAQRYVSDAIRTITSAINNAVNTTPMYSTRGGVRPYSSQPTLLSREV